MAASAAYPRKTLHNPSVGNSKGQSRIDSQSASSYVAFPSGKPFINSELLHSPGKPVLAYPESNSRAIFSALKNLQEKIHKLELERLNAEQSMKRLSDETLEHKERLDLRLHSRDRLKEDMSKQNKDLCGQLSAAETRCHLLEKQLEYMRNMVKNAESERTSVLEKQVSIEGNRVLEKLNIQARLEKLDMLEQEYLKLTTMQVLAEKKISEIEQKLREEEHQRKLVQEKAAQLQTGLETNRILLRSLTPPSKQVKAKNIKSLQLEKKPTFSSVSHLQPHYRLSLGDVPFVAGKSTGTSYSVRANVQHVLHLMKQHNKLLCNDRVVSDQPVERKESAVRWTPDPVLSSRSYQDLSEVLLTLEDEFGQMSFDHQELVKQIQEAHSDHLKEDLERELEALVKRMEAKADQITKVRKHHAMLGKLFGQAKVKKKATTEEHAKERKHFRDGKEAHVSKDKPGERSRKSLQLLRDMQTLQTSLQKEDISWDC
ncbi:hypothetical protein XENTR_v10007110 [Xenopus tropicalis]|uniref:Centrosomal protein CEP57L1 n=1 Tax=Xenopus tropicalis TaxID=8364 RepID=F7C5H8_XENTR|nr:centrosomal protein of 57 kDa isoform X1 [Xenopus tropicalis]KAE8627701.1 hypothetical protein XENTR_v10007110 [Xenopus tropicalis]|eukprot:XP_002935622.1 PREDICTED: centrosomal protein of 57 kDa isoform X1 [Xenopus tropicalis]